jgi:hypothetical protein
MTIYFAVRSREFRTFLADAFFVSAGIQFYLYLVGVSVPLLGTSFVQTPEPSGVRSILHFTFFDGGAHAAGGLRRKGSDERERGGRADD